MPKGALRPLEEPAHLRLVADVGAVRDDVPPVDGQTFEGRCRRVAVLDEVLDEASGAGVSQGLVGADRLVGYVTATSSDQ